MTTLGNLREEICSALAREVTDTKAISWADRGINAAILMVALTYEPPELRTSGTLTALTGQDYITTNTLTRLLRIEEVYNSTGSCFVFRIPFHKRKSLWLPTTGAVKFYSQYGNDIFFSPTPSEDSTLNLRYLQYPSRLTLESDVYPFGTYEDLALSIGIAVAFTFMEETDSANAWLSLGSKFGIAEGVISIVRRFERGEISDDNIQRALQQSSE